MPQARISAAAYNYDVTTQRTTMVTTVVAGRSFYPAAFLRLAF